jgi:hypothetical protein
MPTAPKEILRNLAFYLDGMPVSAGSSKFGVTLSRTKLQWEVMEEPGKRAEKGDFMAAADLDGVGSAAEASILQGLGDGAEDNSSFLLFLRSDTQASPNDVPGTPALFMGTRTFEVDLKRATNTIAEYSAKFELSDGERPFIGKTIYTNRGKVPAPLGAGVVTPAPITLPALTAGMMAAFTVHVPRLFGTARVTVLAEILSDTAGFLSPAVAAAFPLFVNSAPAGTDILVNPYDSWTVYLDGDVTPIPSETLWTIRFTITDAGTDAAVELAAAGTVINK